MSLTVPPPTGNDGGEAVIEQPEGGGGATGTVSEAVAEPDWLLAVTLNVDVLAMLVVTEAVVWPLTPGPDQTYLDTAPPLQAAVSVTDPPPLGNVDGTAVIEHPEGGGSVSTGTVTDAVADPDALLAVTVNVEVAVILVATEGVVCPFTPGPDQRKLVGAPPPLQDAVNATPPPPTGNEVGVAVIEHPEGAGGATGTVRVAVAEPAAFEAVTVKVDVLVMLVVTVAVVCPVTPGPDHA